MIFSDTTLILIGVTALAAFLGARAASRGTSDAAKISRLEQKLDLLLNQFGIADASLPVSSMPAAPIGMTLSASVTEEIMDCIRQGRKIEAIKLYRKQNPGVDLAGAKNAVEQIERTAF